MRLQRVFRMGFAEISCRARQEMAKWIDRRAEPRRGSSEGPTSAEQVDRWLDELAAHFFAGPGDS